MTREEVVLVEKMLGGMVKCFHRDCYNTVGTPALCLHHINNSLAQTLIMLQATLCALMANTPAMIPSGEGLRMNIRVDPPDAKPIWCTVVLKTDLYIEGQMRITIT